MAEHEHVHGTMDVTVQEKTFHGFIKLVTRASIFFIVVLVLIALING